MKTNLQETQRPGRVNSRARQQYNNRFEAKGTLFIDDDFQNNIHIYGFQDLQVFCPDTESWVTLPDKFYVTQDDPEIARSEFYMRWRKYILKRFQVPYIRIEITSVNKN